jgi:hypothetical protein
MYIELTEEEANVVLAGLSELPLKVSMQLAIKIKNECEAQLAKQNADSSTPSKNADKA